MTSLVEGEQRIQAAPEHVLSPLALSNIVCSDTHGHPVVVGDNTRVDLDVHQRAVLVPVVPLAYKETPLLEKAPDIPVGALLIVGNNVVERHAPELFGRVPERLVERVVSLE